MSTIRGKWTTLILHTTSYIHAEKEKLLTAQAFSAFGIVIAIIAAELWLALISLPLYLVTAPVGGSAQETGRFRQRRIITLSIAIVIFLIWLIKLLFILVLLFSSPKNRFSITPTNTADRAGTILTTEIALSPTDPKLAPPQIQTLEQEFPRRIVVSGTGRPNSTIALYFSHQGGGASLHLFAAAVDGNGAWQIIEDEGRFTLPEGAYAVSAVTFDAARRNKSPATAPITFEVHANLLERVFYLIDPLLNFLVFLFIILGLLSVVLVL